MPLEVSQPLVETEWFEKNLQDPSLRIIDCHYFIQKKDGQVSLRI